MANIVAGTAANFAEPGTVSTVAVPKLATATSTKILTVVFHTEDAAVTCTSRPTGFVRPDGGTVTDPVSIDTTGGTMRMFVYRKVCDGSEPATLNFVLSGSAYCSYHSVVTEAEGAVLTTEARSESATGGNGTAGAVTLAASELALTFGGGYASGSAEACTTWLEATGSTRLGFYRTTSDATNEPYTTGGGFDSTRWVGFTMTIANTGGGGGTPGRVHKRRKAGLIYR